MSAKMDPQLDSNILGSEHFLQTYKYSRDPKISKFLHFTIMDPKLHAKYQKKQMSQFHEKCVTNR